MEPLPSLIDGFFNVNTFVMEKWKDIQGFNGYYQVSNKGRVRSFRYKASKKGRRDNPVMLKPNKKKNGYVQYGLTKNGATKTFTAHRLVAIAFLPNKDDKLQINHIDGIKHNNNVENLEWCTASHNRKHAFKIGLSSMDGENHPQSKLTREDVLDIRNAYRLNCFTHQDIADAYGIGRKAVTKIINRQRWKHI